MTQEDKELLTKDLCARLSYGVKVHIQKLDDNKVIDNEDFGYMWLGMVLFDNPYHEIKPYLRPMSSMSEEEKEEWHDTFDSVYDYVPEADDYDDNWHEQPGIESYDWLNEHRFDYRGLIKKGLALEAPEGMYKI